MKKETMENNKKKAPGLGAAVKEATFATGRGLRDVTYATGRSVRWVVPQIGQILREAAPSLIAVAALVGANATINKRS